MSESIAKTSVANPQSGSDAEPGTARSRRNGIQHGLAATTLLPEVFGLEVLARSKERLSAEWCPSTPTEEILVAELARHAAALVLVEQCEAAALRNGARGVLSLSAGEKGASASKAFPGGTSASRQRFWGLIKEGETAVSRAQARVREHSVGGTPTLLL
jgi:hypothetical protein